MLSSNTSAANGAANYIEDVFSTYLYTGNGSTQTITNNIDLSTKGGLVWIKDRDGAGYASHYLADTITGRDWKLSSDLTSAKYSIPAGYDLTSFNSNGFSVGSPYVTGVNNSGDKIASWTFRKQPKFFDVVTWTGDGTDNRAIPHNLGSVPGCIIVKNTSGGTVPWVVKHRSLASASQYLILNNTDAPATTYNPWTANSTSTEFYVNGSGSSVSNGSGATYVAYVYAHNGGGFGLTGTDNVISCDSITTDGSGNAAVTLGYEPQFVLIKSLSAGKDWNIVDTMRGLAVSNFAYNGASLLKPNLSNAESSAAFIQPSATGFSLSFFGGSSETYIYIAIRKGPMKVPTDATKVFKPIFSTTAGAKLTTGFPVDMQFEGYPPGDSLNMAINDRLRGVSTNTTQSTNILKTSSTAAESAPNSTMTNYWDNTGFTMPGYYGGVDYISWNFRRAPSFFDEVCYTGTGSDRTVAHNLGAVPEVIIIKSRSAARNWNYLTNFGSSTYTAAILNDTYAPGATPAAYDSLMQAQPTSTQFSVSTSFSANNSGETYVAYLFATCPGVSKIGSYTGTGTTLQVNCGFTAGARFVLIKKISGSGDWYVWDTARGIVSGNDPYLLLNSTAAEATTTDYIDPYSAGFELSSTAPAALNASGGTYIFLAIA